MAFMGVGASKPALLDSPVNITGVVFYSRPTYREGARLRLVLGQAAALYLCIADRK
jgi:hypothetical protein